MSLSRSEHGGPIGTLVHGITSGIGFATEVHKYKKARKAAKEKQDQEQQVQAPSEEQDRTLEQHKQEDVSHSASSLPPPYTTTPLRENQEVPDAASPARVDSPTARHDLEYSWELDEAQEQVLKSPEYAPRKSKQGTANPDKVIAAFLLRRPPPPAALLNPDTKLLYPVAVPQRRPKDKKRGFIRAYAPDLETVGIDQETWFDMIETLNEASLANPWMNAINLASLAATPLPFAISTAISVAIMVATDVAIEAQSRYRQNKALDKLNQEFFRPRGLYCLVMTWDATASGARTNMDINTTIQGTMDGQGRMSHRFQSSSGVTNGIESIQTAELIFPGLDFLAMASKDEQAGFKKKMERGKQFLDDYLDRRAQAKFLAENPDSHLTQAGKPEFASKYADPTHPMHSSLSVSGMRGALQQNRGLGARGETGRRLGGRQGGGGLLGLVNLAASQVAAHRNQQKYDTSRENPPAPYGVASSGYFDGGEYQQQQPSRATTGGRVGGGLGLKKLLKTKVLYLMVVNMPTEEELAQARTLTSGWSIQGQQQEL
ncbi:uncharacterized protein BO66DRAFT_361146 [Aspergillus aculeatinus CBS 121060]|uniref:Uncharacterized protein n=1 Tax=Aspergillus aculeatinus CBS 121060 TaxID=1448322 RepID=A0ACD1GTA2_9EURO|nr:hypothetical protein BO66DRAFT_361146 [Aspergillus aculeatinus CBS 121060]RAH64411.1 hypothetical protein BO66DRAFT_361146 [Aspergillus aculeatinus CBS 121060]